MEANLDLATVGQLLAALEGCDPRRPITGVYFPFNEEGVVWCSVTLNRPVDDVSPVGISLAETVYVDEAQKG